MPGAESRRSASRYLAVRLLVDLGAAVPLPLPLLVLCLRGVLGTLPVPLVGDLPPVALAFGFRLLNR